MHGLADDSVRSYRYLAILVRDGELWRLKQAKKAMDLPAGSRPPGMVRPTVSLRTRQQVWGLGRVQDAKGLQRASQQA
jgi:hypothetical protein